MRVNDLDKAREYFLKGIELNPSDKILKKYSYKCKFGFGKKTENGLLQEPSKQRSQAKAATC